MTSKASGRLKRALDRIERNFPAAAGTLQWLRQPHVAFVRIPLALLLILGGVFSFLPILGIWMLPLGLILLSLDLAILQGPVGRTLVDWRHRWRKFRRNRQGRK